MKVKSKQRKDSLYVNFVIRRYKCSKASYVGKMPDRFFNTPSSMKPAEMANSYGKKSPITGGLARQ